MKLSIFNVFFTDLVMHTVIYTYSYVRIYVSMYVIHVYIHTYIYTYNNVTVHAKTSLVRTKIEIHFLPQLIATCMH